MNGSTVAWKTLAVAVLLLLPHTKCPAQVQLGHSSRSLLENGEFTRGLDGWRFETWKNNVAKAAVDPNVMHNGRPSIRIDQTLATDSSVTQIVRLKPDRRYRLSGWVKTENIVKPEIANQRKGEEGASIGILGGYQKSISVLGTQNWTPVILDFTTTKAKTEIRLGPRLGHYGKLVTGTAWFAELSLVELGR
jgi:hypothetical protein